MAERRFFDTNLLVYAHAAGEPQKKKTARKPLAAHLSDQTAVFSTQVLQECFVVATRIGLPAELVQQHVATYAQANVVQVTTELIPAAIDLFDRTYDEAVSVALASGARPERMIVDPVLPSWGGRGGHAQAREGWLGQILAGYGDLKASMLQDFERGRTTEVDFINGYVVDVGRQFGVPAPVNAAIVQAVHAITRKQIAPGPALLEVS